MNIIILNKSEKPIYLQVYDQIVSQIVHHELPANYCLPSIRSIAKELNISIITIKNAWDLLEQNSFIYTIAGKGCFVSDNTRKEIDTKKIKLANHKLKSDLEYYKSLGLTKTELQSLIEKLF